MAMLTGNGENPQVYRQWTIDDPQNWLFANRLVYQHGLPGFVNQGTVPPLQHNCTIWIFIDNNSNSENIQHHGLTIWSLESLIREYRIAENFHEYTIFAEKTFADCLLLLRQKIPRLKIS